LIEHQKLITTIRIVTESVDIILNVKNSVPHLRHI